VGLIEDQGRISFGWFFVVLLLFPDKPSTEQSRPTWNYAREPSLSDAHHGAKSTSTDRKLPDAQLQLALVTKHSHNTAEYIRTENGHLYQKKTSKVENTGWDKMHESKGKIKKSRLAHAAGWCLVVSSILSSSAASSPAGHGAS
jgi:hypothetical protein